MSPGAMQPRKHEWRGGNLTNFAKIWQSAFMATMNISLPDPMKEWVEAKAGSGRYSNVSDYIRDLIRREQERSDRIVHMQHLVDEARGSGTSDETMADIRIRALRATKTAP